MAEVLSIKRGGKIFDLTKAGLMKLNCLKVAGVGSLYGVRIAYVYIYTCVIMDFL